MNYDSDKIKKMVLTFLFLALAVVFLRFMLKRNSMTLSEYAQGLPPESSLEELSSVQDSPSIEETLSEDLLNESAGHDITTDSIEEAATTAEDLSFNENATSISLLGSSLNATLSEGARETYAEGFYKEPLSDNLVRFITGISYPDVNLIDIQPAVLPEQLCYLHIKHFNFDGEETEGELICNTKIADDLLEIFYELYENGYQLEKVKLIDEYDGDDTASMLDNNTSCFNYRVVEGSANLSKHAYGFALDINPFYNPYITYNNDKSVNISPEGSEEYADRTNSFPYKIDENDLCYKLFKAHGFTWGGNWNSCKDYQHFQKVVQ